jgi:hypothetical protein
MDVVLTDTVRSKSDRYYTADQLEEIMVSDDAGTTYRETSSYNPEMHDDNSFILRTEAYEQPNVTENVIDIIFEVQEDIVLVITQKSKHEQNYDNKPEFYEEIGSSVTTAISEVR